MSSLYFAICWFKSTYWDFLLCSSLKYPGKKFLPDSSVFNILSDILLMQSFNPYPNGSDMHFKVSFSSSRLSWNLFFPTNRWVEGFTLSGNISLHISWNLCIQVCDSCSIWVTDSILPVLIVLHSHSPDMHHCLFRAQRYGGKRCSSTAVATWNEIWRNLPQSQIPVFIKFHSGYLLIVLASTVENAHETTSWVKSEGFKKRENKKQT